MLPCSVKNFCGSCFTRLRYQPDLANGDGSNFERFGDFAVAEPFFEKIDDRQSLGEHQPLLIGQKVLEEILRDRFRLELGEGPIQVGGDFFFDFLFERARRNSWHCRNRTVALGDLAIPTLRGIVYYAGTDVKSLG